MKKSTLRRSRVEEQPREHTMYEAKGTEPPFTGEYEDTKPRELISASAAANPVSFRNKVPIQAPGGQFLCSAPNKRQSMRRRTQVTGCGDGSEMQPGVRRHLDTSLMNGPQPTGMRYCIQLSRARSGED